MKPSEMVAGLDEAAKRAEKLEEREEAKRRSGGKMNANMALKTDDTGRRWARNVQLLIALVVIGAITGGGFLMYMANRTVIDPRAGNADARQTLSQLIGFASRMKKFDEGEPATAETVVRRITDLIDEDLKKIDEQIEKDKERKAKHGLKYEAPRGTLTKDREVLVNLRKLEDSWGQKIEFTMADPDTLKISAVGKKAPGTEPPEPVTIGIRTAKKISNSPEKTESPEK